MWPARDSWGALTATRGTASDPLGLNRYSYCEDSPIAAADPSGATMDANGDGKIGSEDSTAEAYEHATPRRKAYWWSRLRTVMRKAHSRDALIDQARDKALAKLAAAEAARKASRRSINMSDFGVAVATAPRYVYNYFSAKDAQLIEKSGLKVSNDGLLYGTPDGSMNAAEAETRLALDHSVGGVAKIDLDVARQYGVEISDVTPVVKDGIETGGEELTMSFEGDYLPLECIALLLTL